MPIVPLLGDAPLTRIPRAAPPLPSLVHLDPSAPSAPTLASARPPDWAGWLGLLVLVAAAGLLAWWLLASPLPRPVEQGFPTTRVLQGRLLLAAVVLLSGLLLVLDRHAPGE